MVDPSGHRSRALCSLCLDSCWSGADRHEPAGISEPFDARPGLRLCRRATAAASSSHRRSRSRSPLYLRGALPASLGNRQARGRRAARSGGYRAWVHASDHRRRFRSLSRPPVAASTAAGPLDLPAAPQAPTRLLQRRNILDTVDQATRHALFLALAFWR